MKRRERLLAIGLFFKSLQRFHQTGKYIFDHAGLRPNYPPQTTD